MGQNLVSPAVYWRRRITVLAGGMAVLTLATWGVADVLSGIQASGGSAARPPSASGPAPGRETAARHGSTAAGGHASGGAASGASGASPGQAARQGPGVQAAAGRQGLAGDTTELRTQPSPAPRPSATASPAGTAPSSGSGCANGGVVLTIHSAQSRYEAGKLLTFVINAASTASQPCSVNLGSRFVQVIVASAGTPLWDSASCPRGTISRVVVLRRGVSASVQVTWDGRTSISSCPGQGKLAKAGQYTAAVFDGQLRSQKTTFALAG